MRQINRPVHHLARPVEIMVPNVYNRAALDVTSSLPLSISLTNLRPMIFNLKRTREAMTRDGGLEALVDIMSTIRDPSDPAEELNRKIALQCLNRIGICGPEAVRIRTVEAQILPVLVSKLVCFWRAMEFDVRHAINYELYPPLKLVVTEHGPPHVVSRRRALTTGSSPIPMEGFSGLRIVPTEQIESRIPDDPPQSPTERPPDLAPRMERLVPESVAIDVADDSHQQPMDIDCDGLNGPENESGPEDPTSEVEPLQSPHSELQGVRFPVPFAITTADNSDPVLPTLVGPSMLENQADVSSSPQPAVVDPTLGMEPSELAVHPQPTPEQERSAATNVMLAIPILTPSTDIAVPPNAPLLGHTIPGAPFISHAIPRRRPQRVSILPSQAMSTLYSRSRPNDPQVPTREEIRDCLECLAQLSKLPKLRPYLNSTHFVPNLLHDWLRGEDLTKEVSVFEVVEKFTASNYHPEDVRRWAQVVMRHYNRKDTVMKHRQCGNFKCGKVEPEDRRFILCPVCKYVFSTEITFDSPPDNILGVLDIVLISAIDMLFVHISIGVAVPRSRRKAIGKGMESCHSCPLPKLFMRRSGHGKDTLASEFCLNRIKIMDHENIAFRLLFSGSVVTIYRHLGTNSNPVSRANGELTFSADMLI